MNKNPSRAIRTVLLAGIILIQVWPAFPGLAGQFETIVHSIGQPAVWRGANFFGQEFAQLIAFLHREIPVDAEVILPPPGIGPDPLTTTQYMQYFLFPRAVRNCATAYEACILAFQDEPNQYLVIAEAGRFSDAWGELAGDRVRMFSEDFGVVGPESSAPAGGQPLVPYQSFAFILRDLVLGMLFLLGLWFLGAVILWTWLPVLEPAELGGLGFGLGAGVFSIALAVPLMLGGKLSAPGVWAVYGFLLVLFVSISIRAGRNGPRSRPRILDTVRAEKGLLPVFIFGAVTIFLAVGLGYHRDDALGIWAPKGYGIALTGFPDGPTHWGTLTAEYPLNIPLLIAGMRSVFPERLPESKLIFPFFSVAMLTSIYGYFRRKTNSLHSGLLAVVLGTTPIILNHSIIAYANLAAGYLFISGVFLCASGTKSTALRSRYRLFGSLFLALSAWTRPETLPIAFLTIGVFTLTDLMEGFSLKPALVMVGPLAGYALFWTLVRAAAYSQAGFTSGLFGDVLTGIGRGEFYPAEMIEIGRYFLREMVGLENWGLAGWGFLAGVTVFAIARLRVKAPVPLEASIGLIYIVVILGGYALTPYLGVREHPVGWWIGGGLNRMVLPGVVLVFAAAARRLIAGEGGTKRDLVG